MRRKREERRKRGCRRRGEEEGTTDGKLFPFILQVARALATAEEEKGVRGAACRFTPGVFGLLLVDYRPLPTQRLKLPHCNRRRSSSEVEKEEETQADCVRLHG